MHEGGEQVVARGPALRPQTAPHLIGALHNSYGIRGEGLKDLGGSSNLNLLLAGSDGRRYVVRVYRPWVTAGKLAGMEFFKKRPGCHGGALAAAKPPPGGPTTIAGGRPPLWGA